MTNTHVLLKWLDWKETIKPQRTGKRRSDTGLETRADVISRPCLLPSLLWTLSQQWTTSFVFCQIPYRNAIYVPISEQLSEGYQTLSHPPVSDPSHSFNHAHLSLITVTHLSSLSVWPWTRKRFLYNSCSATRLSTLCSFLENTSTTYLLLCQVAELCTPSTCCPSANLTICNTKSVFIIFLLIFIASNLLLTSSQCLLCVQ